MLLYLLLAFMEQA